MSRVRKYFINCGLEKLRYDVSRVFLVRLNLDNLQCSVDGDEHIEMPVLSVDLK